MLEAWGDLNLAVGHTFVVLSREQKTLSTWSRQGLENLGRSLLVFLGGGWAWVLASREGAGRSEDVKTPGIFWARGLEEGWIWDPISQPPQSPQPFSYHRSPQ